MPKNKKKKTQNIVKGCCFERWLLSDDMSPKNSRGSIQRKNTHQCCFLCEGRNRGELSCVGDSGRASAIQAQWGTPNHSDRRPATALVLVHVGLVHVFLFGAVLGDDESNIDFNLTPGTSKDNQKEDWGGGDTLNYTGTVSRATLVRWATTKIQIYIF